MSDITIPPEALKEAELVAENDGTMEECCIAMLKAWPNAITQNDHTVTIVARPAIILPITENSDG